MKLSNLCDIAFGLPDADFYIYARGQEKSLGMPTTDPSDSKYKIGIKVKDEAKETIDPKYLFYVFMHLNQSQFWQTSGLTYGSLTLKNIRIEDVKNLQVG